MRVCVLCSGGLDSTVLLYEQAAAGRQVHALGIDYGQRHRRELDAARQVAAQLQVPYTVADLSGLGGLLPSSLTEGGTSKVVPNRNAVLVQVAVGFAAAHGMDAVAIGCNADDAADFPDCRPAHLALQEALAREAGIALLYPYVTFTKATIVAIGLGVRAPLDATWSCYLGGEWPCGECDACRARVDAFRGVFGALPR